MLRISSLLTSCFALATPLTAAAAETNVSIQSNGQDMVGTLNLPDGIEKPPVVLMLHGFTGQRNEFPTPEDGTELFTHVAEEMAAKGIASLRIDFVGSGESDGNWADTTFTSQIADAVAAFDYLESLDTIDAVRVGVLGYSQGGLVGAHLAGQRPEAAAVMLWAPVTNPLRTFSTITGADVVEAALAAPTEQLFTAKLSWGGETTLKAAFFHDLVVADPAGAVAAFNGPLSVVVGLKDSVVTPQPAAGQILLDYHPGKEKLIAIDSDHDWGWETSKAIVDTELLPATMEWFVEQFER